MYANKPAIARRRAKPQKLHLQYITQEMEKQGIAGCDTVLQIFCTLGLVKSMND
jgi:hypothetical protein